MFQQIFFIFQWYYFKRHFSCCITLLDWTEFLQLYSYTADSRHVLSLRKVFQTVIQYLICISCPFSQTPLWNNCLVNMRFIIWGIMAMPHISSDISFWYNGLYCVLGQFSKLSLLIYISCRFCQVPLKKELLLNLRFNI